MYKFANFENLDYNGVSFIFWWIIMEVGNYNEMPDIETRQESLDNNEVLSKDLEDLDKTSAEKLAKTVNEQNIASPEQTEISEKSKIEWVESKEIGPDVKLHNLMLDYINKPDFGKESEDWIKVKELLIEVFPWKFKNKSLDTPRQIEYAMKESASNLKARLEEFIFDEETWLTKSDLDALPTKIKQEIEKNWRTDYIIENWSIKAEKSWEREYLEDKSIKTTWWEFVAKDTSFEDSNTATIEWINEKVSELRMQLELLKNNPNVNPDSINIVVNSSASNIPYRWVDWNEGLAKSRAENMQKLLKEYLWDNIVIEAKSEISWPVYPPTIQVLEEAGFFYNWLTHQDVISNYQDPNINAELEKQIYREYQNVSVSLDYQELAKEPIYSVKKMDSWVSELLAFQQNFRTELMVSKDFIQWLDPKDIKEIEKTIKSPTVKESFSNLLRYNSQDTKWYKIIVNTGSLNTIDRFSVHYQTESGIKAMQKEMENQDWSIVDSYQGSARIVSGNKRTGEIKDLESLKKLFEIAGNSESTDKEMLSLLSSF